MVSFLHVTVGFVTCYSMMQMCVFVPSIFQPMQDRGTTTYFIGETLLMLSVGFLTPVVFAPKYINVVCMFLLAHVSSCQIECLMSNRSLLRWFNYSCFRIGVACIFICGSMLVYCPVPLVPEMALALFSGEIAGILVSVCCNLISVGSVWYENLLSKL